MIKTILLVIFVFGISAQRQNQRERLNYIDQLLLPSFAPTQTTGDLTVNLVSYLPKNVSSASITVQLREISDLSNPLTSNLVNSKVCTIASNACSVVFTAPVLDSANKYTIRLDGSSGFYEVSTHAQLTIKTETGFSNRGVKGEIFVSPKGATNPGIKFYVDTVGTWNAHFVIASSPAPTVTSYDFSLWCIDTKNNINEVSTLSLSSSGTLSFTISTVGYYFLTVSLEISKIDSTTRYPIVLDFQFGKSVCASGQFYNKDSKACDSCSSDSDSLGSSTEGKCDCNVNFEWSELQLKCIACPANGCQSKFSKFMRKPQPKVERFVESSYVFNGQYQGTRQNTFDQRYYSNQNQDNGQKNYGQAGFNHQQSQAQVRGQQAQQGSGAQNISQGFIKENLRDDNFGHN